MGYIKLVGKHLPVPFGTPKPNFVQDFKAINLGKQHSGMSETSLSLAPTIAQAQSKLSDFPDEVKQPKPKIIKIIPISQELADTVKTLVEPKESDITYLSTSEASKYKSKKPVPKQKPIVKPVVKEEPEPIPTKEKSYKWHNRIDKVVMALVPIISILSVVIPVVLSITVFIMLFMPYWLVGSVTDIQVPLTAEEIANLTANYSQQTNIIRTPVPSVPNTTIIQVPSSPPIQSSPPPTNVVQVPPPSTTTVTPPPPTTAISGHDTSGIPSRLLFQTEYQCYWDLRSKGYGSYLEVEAECNSHNTGLWQDACTCCQQMGNNC